MRRSLVLITVDCVRADHVGFLGYNRPTTPFLDALARESLVFTNAIAAGIPTYYSFPAILASRFPLALGRDVIGLAGEATLASVLRAEGYATAAFLGGNPYLSSRFGYDYGFAEFRDFLDTKPEGNTDLQTTSYLGRLNRTLSRACGNFSPLRRAYDELYFQYCQRVATPALDSLDQIRPYATADVLVDQAISWLHSQ